METQHKINFLVVALKKGPDSHSPYPFHIFLIFLLSFLICFFLCFHPKLWGQGTSRNHPLYYITFPYLIILYSTDEIIFNLSFFFWFTWFKIRSFSSNLYPKHRLNTCEKVRVRLQPQNFVICLSKWQVRWWNESWSMMEYGSTGGWRWEWWGLTVKYYMLKTHLSITINQG